MASYRIARVSTVGYFFAVQQLYRRRPDLIDAPFEEHRRAVLDSRIGYGEGFSRAMRALGHESWELAANLIRLQGSWARERGMPALTGGPDLIRWLDDVLIDQIRTTRPDVLYIQGVNAFTPRLWRRVRETCPSVRLILGFLGYDLDPERVEGLDHLFVNVRGLMNGAAAGHPPWEVLYHAFDPADGAFSEEADGRRDGFVFSGVTGYHSPDYDRRYRTLLDLGVRADLRMRLEEPPLAAYDAAAAARLAGSIREWREAFGPDAAARRLREALARAGHLEKRDGGDGPGRPPVSALLPDQCDGPVHGVDMHRLLAGARLCFNMHVGIADGAVGNMRMFEATGNGACLLTDHGDNITELFEPDHEVVTYKTIDECVEKARYLLEHEDVRSRIAAAGRARVLADHGWRNRCARILSVVERLLRRQS